MCNSGILLTWTSEEGDPLIREGMAEYFLLLLLFFEGGKRLQEWERVFASGYLVLIKYLGIIIWVKENKNFED